MKRKKPLAVLFCIALLLFIPLSSFAQDISQEGYGISLDDAKKDARENLSRYINGEFISVKTSSSVSEIQKSGMSSGSSSFFSESSSVSMGYLKAIEYIDEKKDENGYRITAVIRDNAVNLAVFESEMDDLIISINSLYYSLSGKDGQIKKGILVSLYGALSEFDNYKRTMIYMGHNNLVPDLGLMITATSVLSDYQNIVLSEGYRLEELEQTITDEAERKKLQDALYENRQEQRKLEREKNDEIAAREEASRNLLIQKLNQAQTLVSSNTAKIETSDFKALLDEALRLKDVFLEACKQCNEIIADEFSEIDRDLVAEAKAVEDRPYRLAELNSDGTPLAQVYSVREDEIDYLYMVSLMHKAEVFKTIRASLFDSIEKKYKDYEEAVKKLNSSFDMSLALKNTVVEYDPVNFKWSITLNPPSEFNTQTKLMFDLSYKELTGKEVQSAKYRGQEGYDEYLQFLDEVDYIDSIMRTFGDYFTVTMTVKSKVQSNTSFKIGFTNIIFSNIKLHITSNAITEKPFTTDKEAFPSSFYSKDLFVMEMPEYLKVFDSKGFVF